MQRKSTRTKEHHSKSKKKELQKPDKFEKEDQKHNKNDEDKENNCIIMNDSTKKIQNNGHNIENQININNDTITRNKKRTWFDTFAESIDSEVDLRCKKMANEAAVLVSHLQKAERVWTMQLPKCVREMNVKEFVDKYNANVNLVMQASLTIGPHEKPAIISVPNDRPIANQKETDNDKQMDRPIANQKEIDNEKHIEKLEKEETQSHQIPQPAITQTPTVSSKETVPQVEVQSFLQKYFTNPNLTVEDRKNQVNFIVKQMHCLERILQHQGKYDNKKN